MSTQGNVKTLNDLQDVFGGLGPARASDVLDLTTSINQMLYNAPTRPSIVLFGDSQTDNQGGPGYTGGVGTNADAKKDVGWIYYAIGQFLKHGPYVVRNNGIGGSTVLVHDGSQNPMINRYQNVKQYKPQLITFLGGVNDVQNFTDTEAAPELVMEGIVTIIDTFLSWGAKVVMQTSWLKHYSSPTATTRAIQAKLHTLAQYQRNYALSRGPNLILVDSQKLLQDNTVTTELNALSTVFFDGLHQGNLGARLIANEMGPKLLAKFPEWRVDRRPYSQADYLQNTRKLTLTAISRVGGVTTFTSASDIGARVGQAIFVWSPNDHTFTGWWTVTEKPSTTIFKVADSQADATPSATSSWVGDVNQLLPNALFLTTSGGSTTTSTTVTGTFPGNTTHACITNAADSRVSAVIDVNARALGVEGDTCGNNCRATITAGGSTLAGDWYRMGLTVAAYTVTRSAGGDTLRFTCGINLTQMSGVIGVRMYAQWSEDGGPTKTTYGLYDDQLTNFPYSQDDLIDLVVETPDYTVAATSGSGPVLQFFIQVNFAAGGGRAVLEVGRAGVYVKSNAHRRLI